MPAISAGLLMYRKQGNAIEFFLVHPGGPFWAKKNEGAWSIPKGLVEANEDLLVTAQREFHEETGIKPKPPFHDLGSVKLKSGKTIHAWGFEGSWNPANGITSNYIDIEWPPRSKKFTSIPEADRAEWMDSGKASIMINPGQLPLLERARQLLT
jgi:predicted NUDIX family NTP pyrophosphohydrolase